jgi:hypothetical protein
MMGAGARHRPLWVIRSNHVLLVTLALAAACNAAGPPSRSVPSEEGGTGGGAEGGAAGKPAVTGGKGGSATGGAGGSGTGGTSGSSGGAGGSPAADAGSLAAADAGASPDGPPPTTEGCAAKFCDDFEGFAAGAQPGGNWKIALDRGTLAVDETRAFSGQRSVKLTHGGAPAFMFMELRQPVLPLAGGVTYGRLMYYITKNPTGQYSHFEIVRGGGPLSGTARAQLNTGAENGKVVINYEPGDCTKYSKVPFPEKKWTCYQFRFDLPRNDIHEWVDNMSADDIPVTPGGGQCWKMPTVVDTLHIGWESYHGPGAELWIDDVAVSDQPIPCPTGMPSRP